ncbi:hypothetical protein SEVIR_7G272200v4 [Setaria viridis]|uniref:Uncharacterized protein n=1 Tax=Setaria viridis TaxID=4556 RepID=A0A4U6TVR2_SETVI|nr:hypothetical protein SEVIR_7G272200v2 [Setaria viridis]
MVVTGEARSARPAGSTPLLPHLWAASKSRPHGAAERITARSAAPSVWLAKAQEGWLATSLHVVGVCSGQATHHTACEFPQLHGASWSRALRVTEQQAVERLAACKQLELRSRRCCRLRAMERWRCSWLQAVEWRPVLPTRSFIICAVRLQHGRLLVASATSIAIF